MYRETVEVDFPWMSSMEWPENRRSGLGLCLYLHIFSEMQFVGTEVAYFHPQVEVGNSLLGNEITVDGDLPIVVVECQMSVETSRLEIAVQHDVLVLVMVVFQRGNHTFYVRFRPVVTILQSVQFQVERGLSEFIFGQQLAQFEIGGRHFPGVTSLLGQGVGVHGHVGVEQTGAALQCAMSREAGRITRNIALKFKEAQTLDEVGQGCCISLQVVEQPWDGLFTDVGLGDFPEK